MRADPYPMDKVGAQREGAKSADMHMAAGNGSGSQAAKVFHDAIMVQGATGIEDAKIANFAGWIDDCPCHQHAAMADLTPLANASCGVNRLDKAEVRLELLDLFDHLVAKPVVTYGDDASGDLEGILPVRQAFFGAQNGIAQERISCLATLIEQAGDRKSPFLFDYVDHYFGVARGTDEKDFFHGKESKTIQKKATYCRLFSTANVVI